MTLILDKPIAAIDLSAMLRMADMVLLSAGAMVVLVVIVLAAIGVRLIRRPVDHTPLRAAPEMLMGPVFAFVCAAMVLQWLLISPPEPSPQQQPTTQASDEAQQLEPPIPPQRQVAITIGAMAVGAGVAYAFGRRCVATAERGFIIGPGHVGRQVAEGVAGVMAALAVCQAALYGAQWLMRWLWPDYTLPEHSVLEALRDPAAPSWLPVVLWLGTALVTPLAEEMFFRGLLQTVLIRTLRRRALGIGIASVVFGLAHAGQPQVVPAIALFGVILGVLYERTGGLIAPIVAHALFNARTLLWETLHYGGG